MNKVQPSHYDLSIVPIDVIESWGLGFCLGNCVKYISRSGKKEGETTLDDLRKARWYLDRHINFIENSTNKSM